MAGNGHVPFDVGKEGGAKLRALRNACGLTQLTVELEASLGTGYLQRVESGRVQQPERETLQRILDALAATFAQRRDVLETFGYAVTITPPLPQDIAWAIQQTEPMLHKVSFPAYLLTCTHHLLAWNVAAEALFRQVGIQNLANFQSTPIFHLFFQGILPSIHNPAEFLTAVVQALRHEISKFQHEAWCISLIESLLQDLPLFKTHWELTASNPPSVVAARPLVPLEIAPIIGGKLKFRITAEPLTADPRFRVVYYLPADVTTLQLYTHERSIFSP
ncbi:MAG: helix-turn-helix domain-containing protein [Anaerolineae bacterium]|nr:MAG: helix-turn-helix domain-containing protein [Anaerolineae bacterium]